LLVAGRTRKQQEGELGLKECWYPIQVKQKDKAGRPDIDSFEAMMMREGCEKGFFVSFDYSSDALQEIESFFKRSHKVIVALTDLICTSSLNPAFSPRRRRIVHRPLENSRAGICRTVNQITETVIAKSSPRLVAP
jgi:Restriction endonuclease